MKTLKKITESKLGVYGIIITLVSIAATIFTLLSREAAINEFEKTKVEEHCFDGTGKDPEWEKMTIDERKARSNRCMGALNKVTQVKSGPYIFSFTLVIGILLIVLSIIKSRKEAAECLEEQEENDDNKLS